MSRVSLLVVPWWCLERSRHAPCVSSTRPDQQVIPMSTLSPSLAKLLYLPEFPCYWFAPCCSTQPRVLHAVKSWVYSQVTAAAHRSCECVVVSESNSRAGCVTYLRKILLTIGSSPLLKKSDTSKQLECRRCSFCFPRDSSSFYPTTSWVLLESPATALSKSLGSNWAAIELESSSMAVQHSKSLCIGLHAFILFGLLVSWSSAYPYISEYHDCLEHPPPDEYKTYHTYSVDPDVNTGFVMTVGGQVTQVLCPGAVHTIEVGVGG